MSEDESLQQVIVFFCPAPRYCQQNMGTACRDSQGAGKPACPGAPSRCKLVFTTVYFGSWWIRVDLFTSTSDHAARLSPSLHRKIDQCLASVWPEKIHLIHSFDLRRYVGRIDDRRHLGFGSSTTPILSFGKWRIRRNISRGTNRHRTRRCTWDDRKQNPHTIFFSERAGSDARIHSLLVHS